MADLELRHVRVEHKAFWRVTIFGCICGAKLGLQEGDGVEEMAEAYARHVTEADLSAARGELRLVDEALARRPALADCPTRFEKIERACRVAGEKDAAAADLAAARERIRELEERVKVNERTFIADGKEVRLPVGPLFDAAAQRITALTEALRVLVVEDRNEYSGVRLLKRGRDLTILEYLNQDEAAKVRAAAALLREGESKT